MRPLNALLDRVQQYWNERIHDLEMTRNAPGTREFFEDLDEYRFDKLRYLPRLVDFGGYRGKALLEVGCGIGTDLVRFAKGGAVATGVDLSETALDLARKNAHHAGVELDLRLANGEALPFEDSSFDVVYAHGVLQYTAEPRRMVEECRRVLRPDGEAIFMVYNRISWLNGLSKVMRVDLEHGDAPVLRKYSIGEYRALLSAFETVRIVPERFPVKTRLHGGWKGFAYNKVFVSAFEALPRSWVRPLGWHLMAFCRKA
jgi:SAM-dependent methyltransferase